MDVGLFIKGMGAGFIASIPLGPVAILIIQRTLNKGRWSGLASGMGAGLADTIYAAIAGFGFTMVMSFIKEKQLYFEIMGAALLFFIGIKMYSANVIKQARAGKKQRHTLIGDFFSIAAITISNPLIILLFIAIFAWLGIEIEEFTTFTILYFAIGVYAGASIWWLLITFIINLFRDRFRLKNIWWINKIAGVAIILFGLYVIFGMFFLKKPL